MRLFIAILPEDNMIDALLTAQDALRSRHFTGRFTDRRNLHLTLSFIGEYSDPDAAAERMALVRFSPFRLTFSGYIGSFGDLLWAGAENSPALEQYVRKLRHMLAEGRIPYDKKKFHPHITLLRNAKSAVPFTDIVIPRESMTVHRISLMRSDFGRHGAQYTEIAYTECTE